ncbi:MAG: dihydroorotate dehydrogenase [Bacteroidales bacterium]|nr:dihydroorotate dehydrogenase [Bacteroidales bacterium]
MVNTSVNLGKGLVLKNPVLTASGTFGYGIEYDDFFDVSAIGGFIVKGTTLKPREGNPYPRLAETPCGMLNAVGLQNKGVDYFCESIYPKLLKYSNNPIVNVSGSCVEDYVETARRIAELEHIPAIELNISCPNVKQGGMSFGTVPAEAAKVVSAVRKAYPKHLMVKLTPNVTDISAIAKAVEEAGADSVSLINTMLGMAIDAEKRRPVVSTVTAGLSGPAIKPVALRMVWQVSKVVNIPIVGLGGIVNASDAVEFLLAGASAVQIGTANFLDPTTPLKVANGIKEYMERHGFDSVDKLTGALIV